MLGPIALCVGSFLPFSVTYYLYGHHFIERELERAGVPFRKDDNAFLWVADQKALQAAADRLSAQVIRKQLDHWTWVVGPKFSQKDRAAIILGHLPLLTRPENIVHFFRDIRYGQNSGIPRPAGCQTALQMSPSVPSFDSCLENKIIRQRTDGDQNFKYVWVVIASR